MGAAANDRKPKLSRGRTAIFAFLSAALIVAVCGARFDTYRDSRAGLARFQASIGDELPGNRRDEYVSSAECRRCHPGEYASWHESYHRTMTQAALPETVMGEFDGSTIVSEGLEYRVFRKGNEFWAEMPDPEELMYVVQGGKPTPLEKIPRVERRVVMTTGSHHYQTYWVTGDDKYGNLLQTLPLVYLPKEDQWIPREEAFMRPSDSGRMITQWNHHCIRCHSTGGNPGLVGEGQQSGFATEVGELGISCEACHGPGREHVERYSNPLERYASHIGGDSGTGIVNPDDLDHQRSSEICGQCHSVFVTRSEFGMEYARKGVLFRPGESIERTRYQIQHPRGRATAEAEADFQRNRSFFRERWWDNGTILAGGREFTAMSASACYQEGTMSCGSCHTMHHGDPNHQLKPGMDTNLACTGCHTRLESTEAVVDHSRHPAGSSGSECMNCHMPHNTYALFSAIRSHQIVSPSAAESVETGVPNACNLCHLDKSLRWTQDHLAEWYGAKSVRGDADQESLAAGVLWMLRGDAAQRAVAGWHAGWLPAQRASGNTWLAPHVAALLADPYGVVRYVGKTSLGTLPGFDGLEYDFLAPKKELAAAAAEAIRVWSERDDRPTRTGAELLIHDERGLMGEQVKSLLRRRNNRPVVIKE